MDEGSDSEEVLTPLIWTELTSLLVTRLSGTSLSGLAGGPQTGPIPDHLVPSTSPQARPAVNFPVDFMTRSTGYNLIPLSHRGHNIIDRHFLVSYFPLWCLPAINFILFNLGYHHLIIYSSIFYSCSNFYNLICGFYL